MALRLPFVDAINSWTLGSTRGICPALVSAVSYPALVHPRSSTHLVFGYWQNCQSVNLFFFSMTKTKPRIMSPAQRRYPPTLCNQSCSHGLTQWAHATIATPRQGVKKYSKMSVIQGFRGRDRGMSYATIPNRLLTWFSWPLHSELYRVFFS